MAFEFLGTVKLSRVVVDHMLGDRRVLGWSNLVPDIEKALRAMLPTCFKSRPDIYNLAIPQSLMLDVRPLAELDPRKLSASYSLSGSMWDGGGRLPYFRLRLLNGEGVATSISQCPLPWVFFKGPESCNGKSYQGTYTVYVHILEVDGMARAYAGITRQGWTARYRQHVNAAGNGSPYLFHEALRRRDTTRPELHSIVGVGLSFEEAMEQEEKIVAGQGALGSTLYPHGLNMIPGGFAGLRYLAKYGFKHVGPKQWENRQQILREFQQHCEREGKPNPLMAARWHDDGYAQSVIFGNPNNFTREQVDEIRYMASLDHSAAMIAEQFRCDVRRVNQLLAGRTYSRA